MGVYLNFVRCERDRFKKPKAWFRKIEMAPKTGKTEERLQGSESGVKSFACGRGHYGTTKTDVDYHPEFDTTDAD